MTKRKTTAIGMCRMTCMQTCMRCIMLSSKREIPVNKRFGV